MFNRSTRLRLRRVFRRRQRQVEAASQAAEAQLDKNFIARLDRLWAVKHFVLGWLLICAVLIIGAVLQILALSGYYQTLKPISGGSYNEGIIGTYSNASPLYATGAVDTSVSHLIFSGLFTYNDQNQLVGDLANNYTVDQTGKHYTVTLRPNLTWQDGQPLTAADVAFTYHLIQNPDAQSPFISSWQGITVTAVNASTISFDLPTILSSFPYSLTNGIVPEHLLNTVPMNQLRSSDFNTTKPVGSGPFAWKAIQIIGTNPSTSTTLLDLKPFTNYHTGAPKLGDYVVKVYTDSSQMVRAFQKREINGMSGLDEVPAQLQGKSDTYAYSFPLSAATMTFFKTTTGVLSDGQVRQALIKGTNTQSIINSLGYTTLPVKEPLLLSQLGFDSKYTQSSFDPIAAGSQLTADGWVPGSDGMRSKAGQALTFRIYAQDTPENQAVLHELSQQWRKIGVDAIGVPQSSTDFQTTLQFHTYDALLYGISIGVDPDVFAYWDSSQADIRASPRLNFSEYKSSIADTSLEAGRTRSDEALRVIKYKPFLQAWQSDAPALGLYQPRYLYITNQHIAGLNLRTLNNDFDRYNSVSNWEIRTARITNN